MKFIYGLDINIKSKSPKNGNTGWVRLDNNGVIAGQPGFNIKELGESIAKDLFNGHQVSLGFEAPMWYPVPKYDTTGRFQMTARFKEEETSIQKANGNYESSKRWYVGGSQPMVKGYPLGLLLFEWMIAEYERLKQANKQVKCFPVINATASYEEWSKDIPLYLYEGFVTGSYKPTATNFAVITKNNTQLDNNEFIDAFIAASALSAFVVGGQAKQSPLNFPNNNYQLTWLEHLRVVIEEDPNKKAKVLKIYSCITDPISGITTCTPYTPSASGLQKPERVLSVWEHIIRDVNDLQSKSKITLTDKKACDVYGFKFR